MWGHLFIFFSTVASLYIVYKEYGDSYRDYKLALLWSGIIWLLSQVVHAVDIEVLHSIPDILVVFANSTLLTSFLMLIRNLKPEFFRYPYPTVFVPFMLPVAYLTVLGSSIMQSLIFFSMQAVTVLVFIILSIGYWKRMKLKPKLPLAAIILLTLAFIVHWALEDLHNIFQFIWQLFLSLGMIFSVYTFSDITRQQNFTEDTNV